MTKIEEFRCIKLEGNKCLSFINSTPKLGRAEFQICSKYKRKKLAELFIYLEQQENIDYYYYWQGKANGLYLGSWNDLNKPEPWFFGYCEEHKCQTMRMYVPNNSKYLFFEILSSINIYFCKTKYDD
jgi:hypothetical protein